MKKITTLYVRNPDDMSHVTDIPHPLCGWVFDGEGVPTRKWDGTCVLYDGTSWWFRRSVAHGRKEPPGFVPTDRDTRGRTYGWEPASQSGYMKYLNETSGAVEPGTYELCGPRINGNHEKLREHILVRHLDSPVIELPSRDYTTIREVCLRLLDEGVEGIVFHRNPGDQDTEMAKLKGSDFPRSDG